jgi:2-keto-3-deoxy-L-rhamnonate aldolase RhmA
MTDTTDPASRWKNPLNVANPGAEKLSQALLLGQELRSKTLSGTTLGTFLIELPCPTALATLALAGFDFVVLDMEHSALDFSGLEMLINAGHAAGIAMLVRTWGEDVGLIGKALDLGASGILAPHVESAERARAIVAQARFSPSGRRGFSPLTKYDSLTHPFQALDASTYVVVQIEGRAALESVREIAAVPGIDAVFIGPYDLALSLDVEPGSAPVIAAAERVATAVPANVTLGIYIDDPAHCGAWAARRFTLQCVSFDGRMLANGVRSVIATARGSIRADTAAAATKLSK